MTLASKLRADGLNVAEFIFCRPRLVSFFLSQNFHLKWHKMLHALGLGAGVVVAVAFQQVDRAPYAEPGAERYHESLKYADC